MEPIRLLRWRGAWPNVDEYRRKVEEPTHEQRRLWGCDEYTAIPRAEYDALIAQRDGATARADAASDRLARAEALLREARTVGIPIHRHEIAARIDALLNDAPTDEDRRGEDGAWTR